VNRIGGPVEQAQRIEFGKKILESKFVLFLHLDQSAQAQHIFRDGNAMLAGNIEHGIQSQRAFQVPVELHFGEDSIRVKRSRNALC
jgi:hypothetical protein